MTHSKMSYYEALEVIREHIRQKIDENAKRSWDRYDYIREEYDSFGEYLVEAREMAQENECPGGVNLEVEIFGKLY